MKTKSYSFLLSVRVDLLADRDVTDDMRRVLGFAANHLASNGLLTGDLGVELTGWSDTVTCTHAGQPPETGA